MQPKIRINDLARELEVKSKSILDILPLFGVTEKKTFSSSIEADEAERVRAHFRALAPPGAEPSRTSRADANVRTQIDPKFDLSHISKPGDVLKLISRPQAPAAPTVKPPSPRSSATAETPVRSALPQVGTNPAGTAPLISMPPRYAEPTEAVAHATPPTLSAPTLPTARLEREHFLFLTLQPPMLLYEYHSRKGTRSSDRGTF